MLVGHSCRSWHCTSFFYIKKGIRTHSDYIFKASSPRPLAYLFKAFSLLLSFLSNLLLRASNPGSLYSAIQRPLPKTLYSESQTLGASYPRSFFLSYTNYIYIFFSLFSVSTYNLFKIVLSNLLLRASNPGSLYSAIQRPQPKTLYSEFQTLGASYPGSLFYLYTSLTSC